MIRKRRAFLLIGAAAFALLLAACFPAPPPRPEPKASPSAAGAVAKAGGSGAVSGDVEAGKALFTSKGCVACHVASGVPGAVGTIGPNLNGIGNPATRPTLADGGNNTPEHIREWIQNPQQLKPGTMMPALGLSDKEAGDLTAFLVTLK